MRYFHYIRKSTDDDEHQKLSPESQERENLRRFGDHDGIEIVETIQEARSAKYPGRPLFNDMIERIERGEADGIIAWHPDRLARNSIDGGKIVYLLDTGAIKDLKFTTYTYENTPQGKFMLQILFANAKYHVDSMSENIRRGNRTKVENGWRPNLAPIGYLNDKDTSTIVADPERFPLVKRLWELALTGAYTIPQLLDLATNEWGLRTKKRKKLGGKPLTVSGIYRLFQNPFYVGILRHERKDYPGKHPPVVTLAQFEEVQRMLGRVDAPRLRKHHWDYTGLLKCSCGLSITAEEKTNRFGTKYTYYHCTRRRKQPCAEPYVQLPDLERDMKAFIQSVTVDESLHKWALRKLDEDAASMDEPLRAARAALERAGQENELALKNLRHLRTHEQITEAEFLTDRTELLKESARVSGELLRLSTESMFEPERAFILFNVRGLKWFDEGDGAIRRLLIEAAGSNPVLDSGALNIDGRFPFRRYKNRADIRELCTALNDIRTPGKVAACAKLVAIVKRILALTKDSYRLEAAA